MSFNTLNIRILFLVAVCSIVPLIAAARVAHLSGISSAQPATYVSSGVVICNEGTLELHACNFSGHGATYGSAIFNEGVLSLDDCILAYNGTQAGVLANGIATATINIQGSTFHMNKWCR